MSHAELGASKAERWINCPGSVALTRGLVETESEYAKEGTAAHKVANLALTRGVDAITFLGTAVEGFEVTEEMCEAVRVYIDAVCAVMAEDPGSRAYYEQEVTLAPLNPPGEMYGTSDTFVFSPARSRLVVFDLKYGAGVVVEVENNAQGRFYALGALLKIEQGGLRGRIHEIEIVIVQPRAFHQAGIVRREVLTYMELVDFAGDLFESARRTLEPDAPLVPGKWCRFCPAAGQCPALRTHATELAMVEFDRAPLVLPPSPALLSNADLARVLDGADLVEDFFRAARQAVQTKLELGEAVPGWKLVPKRATRKWVDENAAALFAAEAGLVEEQIFKTEVRSPAQFEKMLKPHRIALDAALYTKESSGVTLAPSGDRREEVTAQNQIADVFDAEPIALLANPDIVEAEILLPTPRPPKRTSQRKGRK